MKLQESCEFKHNRRDLLKTFVTTTTATALGVSAFSKPSSLAAIEPIKRNGTSKIKFSLAAYSYRKLLSGGKPKLSLFDFVDDCAKMQLEGTELTSYYFPKKLSDEYLLKLKRHCFQSGLDVSGTAVGNDFCHPKGKTRDSQIALVKRWIDYAEVLTAPVIRIFSGRPHGTTQQVAHKLAVDAISECCEYAGKHGVHLALENHGGLTTKVDDMLKIVRDVKSKWFGVNMDTGNFHSQDVYGDLAKVAPYTLNVQVKVSIKPANGKKQRSDYKKLAKILKESGYRGYVVLEYEENADPRKECPVEMEKLREAFA